MSKLNNGVDYLWQCPKQSQQFYNDSEWYEAHIVGHDPLERFMKFFTDDANLEGKNYTNHSIRATVIQTLDKAGFEARHIIKLSSHKNESSVKEYATDCSDDKRKAMFDSLSHALKPTTPKDQQENSNNNNVNQLVELPEDMKLEELGDWDTIDDNFLSNLIKKNYNVENLIEFPGH